MSDNSPTLKKKRYKLYLDPTYNESEVSETTARRWKNFCAPNASTTLEYSGETLSSDANYGFQEINDNHQIHVNNYDHIVDDSSRNRGNSAINECTESHSSPNVQRQFLQTNGSNRHISNASMENDLNPVQDDDTEESSESEESSEDECHTFESIHERRTTNGHTIMFEASGITVDEVCDMIIALSLRFEWTKEATSATMNMAKIFAGAKFHSLNLSCYNTEKKFSAANSTYSFIYYCSNCNCILTQPLPKNYIKNTVILCTECRQQNTISLNVDNHFIYLDIEHQLSIMLRNKYIYKELISNIEIIKKKSHNNPSIIADLYDGHMYKSNKSIIEGNSSKNSLVLTYNFNTDGAPVFKSSKRSFWPLQLSINEFPPQSRFNNLILIALCVVKKEPSHNFMNIFLEYFVQKAQELCETGFVIKNYVGREINVKLVPLLGIVDSVARPILQNRVQFNGYYGCSWCYEHGTYIKGCVRYCMYFDKDDAAARTRESHLADIVDVHRKVGDSQTNNRNINHRGVKDEAKILSLPSFDIVWGFPVEYMHGMILGVAQQLWELWTTAGSMYSLKADAKKKINSRLINIKPPREIYRSPRSLQERNKWKAAEWLSWTLYYSFPCLENILERNILKSFLLFVRSLHVLLQNNISHSDLNQCYLDLYRFVAETQLAYDGSVVTFNLHSAIHLCDSVRQSGPLWAASAFPYESNIYKLKRLVKSPKNVDVQIVENYLKRMNFRCYMQDESISGICSSFCNALFNKHALTLNFIKTNDNAVFLGTGSFKENVTEYSSILKIHFPIVTPGYIFERCIFESVVYHTARYSKSIKMNDSIVKLKESNKIMKICDFLVINNFCTVIGKELITDTVTFENLTINYLLKVKKIGSTQLFRINEIDSKIIEINTGEQTYLCKMPYNYDTC